MIRGFEKPQVDHLVGIVLVVLSAATFATLAIFGRYALADGMDAFTILFLRFSLAAIPMLALLIIRREQLPRGPVLLKLIGMGAVGYVGQTSAYLTALKYASAGLVALLLYLYPVFVALLAVLVLREPFTGAKGLALGLALVGTAFTVGSLEGQALGILLAIAAAVVYSVYIIVGTSVTKQVSAVRSSAVIFAAAGMSAGALMIVNGPHLPSTSSGWSAIASIVVISTMVPVMTFLAGLERIGPTNAAMFSTLEPVVTVLLARWWLNETLTPLTLLGGGLILTAVLLLTRSELRCAQPIGEGESTPGE
jgi:drug/metabolite transporter (DMT)-like permease